MVEEEGYREEKGKKRVSEYEKEGRVYGKRGQREEVLKEGNREKSGGLIKGREWIERKGREREGRVRCIPSCFLSPSRHKSHLIAGKGLTFSYFLCFYCFYSLVKAASSREWHVSDLDLRCTNSPPATTP